MWKWLTRLWQAGDAAVRAHAIYIVFGAIATIFTTLAAAMSVVANWVTNLHGTYGLGAIIFVGIGAACIIVLVICAALVAWRFFNPLPKTQLTTEGAAGQESKVHLTAVGISGLAGLDEKIAELNSKVDELRADDAIAYLKGEDGAPLRKLQTIPEPADIASKGDLEALGRKVEVTRLEIPPLEQRITELVDLIKEVSNRLTEYREAIVQTTAESRQNSESITSLQGAITSLRSDRAWMKRAFGHLTSALEARDIQAKFKANDEIVWNLGLKLLRTNPPQYDGPDAWLVDCRTWHDALFEIDAAKGALGNQDRPFLDISPMELKACLEMPPDVVAADGNTVVPYKEVHLAFRRYERYRDKVTKFFEMKAKLPTLSNIP
jgi:hypothetical protein